MYVSLDEVQLAKENIKGHVRRTPLMYQEELSENTGNEVYLKLENLQLTGSFKVRGAMNKVHSLDSNQKENGIVSFSAGNHGSGAAYAAKVFNIPSVVVMPNNPNPEKVSAIKSYKSKVILGGDTSVEMFNTAFNIHEKDKMTMVHPFDDEKIIAGQGTIGLEIMEDLPDVDVVICAVSGGGLISGISTAIKQINPKVKIIGVNSEGAQAMYSSLQAGMPIEADEINTIADGLTAKKPGDLNFQHTKKYVDELVLVSEEAIKNTVGLITKLTKTIVEPSGAAALAALLSNKIKISGKKVAIIVSGSNISNEHLESLVIKNK